MAAVLQSSTSSGFVSPRLSTPRSTFFGLSNTKPLSFWISLSRRSSSSVRSLLWSMRAMHCLSRWTLMMNMNLHEQVRGLPTLYFISRDPNKDAIRTEGLLPSEMIKNIIDNEMREEYLEGLLVL
ncbi:uncharacterized protein LOC103722352 isoform X2 [Phoenix dactylifera]|uniref:Uncharacterized protein LOC103722352 isoform X2 n=1 Tax=Phoenix dactylifera TaxID=42345 RepID=A0A8B7MX89_PHODC|nr:uncharacterized protein LOC103722352 isoform X2 [Phoenix dactylifera]